MWIFDAINIFSKGINTMADSIDQADAALKSADAAWTAARSKIHPSNTITRKLNLLKSDGADNPNSPDHGAYLNFKSQYDAAVSAEASAKQAYLAAQENYKQVYNSENSTPTTGTTEKPATSPSVPEQSTDNTNATGNPSPAQATEQASGPQAQTFAPTELNENNGVVVGGPIGNSTGPIKEQVLDKGEDPYVSNGQTTIAPDSTVSQPAEISPSSDPFEESRLAAEQANNEESPTEQSVIDAEEDPFEQARMQRAQDNTDEAPTEQSVIDAEEDPFEAARLQREQDNEEQAPTEQAVLDAEESGTGGGARSVDANPTRSMATIGAQLNTSTKNDWRLRLSLAPAADYLYKQSGISQSHVLYPLAGTNGVIFPYTPNVSTTYRANYEAADLVHSNYKMYFYKNSNVDDIQITADFTAQDTTEARYMLAVIHFFKSVTKMFYGQDPYRGGPKNGTPPPLCFLNGYGAFQFNNNPVLISSFNYSLPNDVDYIRATYSTQNAGTNVTSTDKSGTSGSITDILKNVRLFANNLTKGAFNDTSNIQWQNYAAQEATYVPTKLQIQLSCIPVATRNDISNNFSLGEYATGELTKTRGFW